MRIAHLFSVLAFASFGLVACAAPTDATEGSASSSSEEALTKTGGRCTVDASCVTGDVCELNCPVIPGRMHCMIVGGTCEARCTRSARSLQGSTFTSANSAHSITFAADGTFKKTDGCDPSPSGVTCHHIQLTTGTYRTSSTGKTVYLTGDLGQNDTLTVEPHCYDGLLDTNTNVELY